MLSNMLEENLDKLNSMTKYPSIYTYHELGDRGTLNEKVLHPVEDELIGYATEKVDGTNSRIILTKDDYIIGARENLLYSRGDRIIDTTMGISEKLIPIAESLLKNVELKGEGFVVVYGEVYGGNIGRNKKNYTKSNKVGYRVFDVVYYSNKLIKELLLKTVDNISSWREHGGQNFVTLDNLDKFCDSGNLDRVPSLFSVDISKLPTNIEGMHDIISKYSNTLAGLDNVGVSEGIVIRSNDRTYIRKIRLEEYKKTLK